MKIVLITIALLSTVLLFWFCKQTKYTSDQLPAEQIRFGRGGGFVGKESVYTLLQNGQIFLKGIDGKLAETDDAKSKVAKSCFKTIEQLNLATLKFEHPANTYSFIEVPAGDTFNRITWGDNNYPVDPAIQELFLKLMALTPDKK
jgi:hypothetical protein